jgi:hypothetical protein
LSEESVIRCKILDGRQCERFKRCSSAEGGILDLQQ